MKYVITRGLPEAKHSAELARSSRVHWVRLADQTLIFDKAWNMAEFDRQVQRTSITIEPVEGESPSGELYLISQIGRAFEDTHPDASILINKGRYLVVELVAEEVEELDRYEPLYWRMQPLPLDRVILDVRDPVAREVVEWVSNLVSAISETTYSEYLIQLAGFHTRHSLSAEFDDAAALALHELQSLGYEVQLQTINLGADNSVNVIADSPGQSTSPRDLVIVTAHLDSINTAGGAGAGAPAPGADDNASGSAAVLELARVLADHPARHDLRLILFGGEEQGLHGSAQYVASLVVTERNRIRAVINMDMIATLNTSSPTVLIESSENYLSLINELSDAAATYTDLIVQTSFNPFASDHVPFINEGIPALLTIEGADGSNNNVHTANDTLAHVNYGLALSILRMNVATTCLMVDIEHPAIWATCTVNRAGPAENGIIYIHLHDHNGTFNHWFQASPGMQKEMLATALAAMEMDAGISVFLEDTVAYSQISRLYASTNTSQTNTTNSAINLLLLGETEGIAYSDYLLTMV